MNLSSRAYLDAVEPIYIKKLPLKDGWNNDYQYFTDNQLEHYWIISYGADGRKDESVYGSDGKPIENKMVPTSNLNADIIFSDGVFLRHPEAED